jgi:lysyl-tRNA synthetase class 1
MRERAEVEEWSLEIAEELIERKGEHVIATGISPSGPLHIGNLREIVIAECIRSSLEELGARTKLICVADTLDPLRKLYPFLPESFQENIGKPLSLIPDPSGCCESYADHFLNPYLESIHQLEIRFDFFRADQLYKNGKYLEATRISLSKRNEIARILMEVSGREIPKGWSPFTPICGSCEKLTTSIGEWDEKVLYTCSCGYEGETSLLQGKLTWRIDWPARWKIFGVTVEPFGKDLAAAGGSYDSGKRIAREIFGYDAPYPVPFEHILLRGKGKLSSSAGLVITPKDLLDIMSPKLLFFLLAHTKPRKHIEFDPGMNLVNLMDRLEKEEIPFSHLINIVQLPDPVATLKRKYTFDEGVKRRMGYARNWLEKFAPDEAKFTVSREIPEKAKELSALQKKALLELSKRMEDVEDAETIHQEIYAVASRLGIEAKKIFEAIYISFLGKNHGPRAGLFLSSLDKNFVRRRMEEIAL